MFKNIFNMGKCDQTLNDCFISDEGEPSQFLNALSRVIFIVLIICHGL